MFQLSWQQHGGSGLGWSRTEVLELGFREFQWMLQRIDDQRGREARAIDRAAKGR